ncbi:MAG: head-tail connector protein, partial [Bilophila wadsworthia]
MTIRQLTPPESEPVTLEQAKGFVRVDTDADDALLSLLITAARQEAEAITGRALGESTWAVSLPALPGMLEVPLVPCTELVEAAVGGMAVKPEQYGFVPSGMALREPLRAAFVPGPDFPQGETVLTVRAG